MSDGQVSYQVFITPLLNSEGLIYSSEVEVTEHIRISGIGTIRRSIDSSDYDIGVFVFSDLELTGFNLNGYFEENSIDMLFPSMRDRAKVRIVFKKSVLTRVSSGTVESEIETSTNTFHGLINEEGTRSDLVTDSIKFKVLSRDSVLRTTRISGGTVSNTNTFKQAIESILNTPRITAVLDFDATRINPALDLVIDNGPYFDNKSVKEALDKLLLASNSVLLINDAGEMTVRSRDPSTAETLNLYGKNDELGRENIIDITAYNTGKHRVFNSITIATVTRVNTISSTAYGLKSKKIDFEFITTESKRQLIADTIVDEFKIPKIELNVKVSTDLAKTVDLLDLVSVNYPLRLRPPDGAFLPVVGITKIDETDQPLPYTFGSIEIPSRLAFKVVEVEDNPERYTSILKLRQVGKDLADGVFDTATNCIVDFATVDFAVICTGGSDCDQYEIATLGNAVVDCTLVA